MAESSETPSIDRWRVVLAVAIIVLPTLIKFILILRSKSFTNNAVKPGSSVVIRSRVYPNLHPEFVSNSEFAATAKWKLSIEQRLRLYGLYKQATLGDCNTPRPGLIDQADRAKWDSWRSFLGLSSFEASKFYVATVESLKALVPYDVSHSARSMSKEGSHRDGDEQDVEDFGDAGDDSKGMGRGVSVMSVDKSLNPDQWIETNDLFSFARDGDLEKLSSLLSVTGQVAINQQDDTPERLSALHYAVDRGHVDVVAALLKAGADPNAKDSSGASPLAYAVTCEYADIAELLLRAGASPDQAGDDGATPRQMVNDLPPTSDLARAFSVIPAAAKLRD